MAEKGERAVPYSFRHSYSLRGHRRGVDAGSVALSMGHSFEVHCRSYPWASASGAAEAFERANAALAFGLNLPVKDATIPINSSTHSECVADIAMS
jgi:hypothetical protein